MKLSPRLLVFLGLFCLLLVAGLFYWLSDRQDPGAEVVATGDGQVETPVVPVDPSSGSIQVGGVNRPATDFAGKGEADGSKSADQEDSETRLPSDGPDYGHSPAIELDANPQVAAVVQAAREKNRPELFSPVIAPKKFDPEAYAKSPEEYLNSPEPGRVFVPAQPGEDVKEIRRVGGSYLPVVQGESVKLAVEATPGAPVTFTSFDLGLFSNQLTTISVAANERGLAVAEFFASPGTIDKVNILAASPVTSGQVKFVVDISLPQTAGN